MFKEYNLIKGLNLSRPTKLVIKLQLYLKIMFVIKSFVYYKQSTNAVKLIKGLSPTISTKLVT